MLPDYCSEGGALRKMETAKLLKTAPHIHTMIENLLDIDVRKHANTPNEGQDNMCVPQYQLKSSILILLLWLYLLYLVVVILL